MTRLSAPYQCLKGNRKDVKKGDWTRVVRWYKCCLQLPGYVLYIKKPRLFPIFTWVLYKKIGLFLSDLNQTCSELFPATVHKRRWIMQNHSVLAFTAALNNRTINNYARLVKIDKNFWCKRVWLTTFLNGKVSQSTQPTLHISTRVHNETY